MKTDYIHKDTLTATDYVNLQKDNELIVSYNQQLLKENNELKKQLEDANEKIILLQASEPMLNYKKSLEETQQKEFIKYLEGQIKTSTEVFRLIYKNILQKYKGIIGVSDENNKQ